MNKFFNPPLLILTKIIISFFVVIRHTLCAIICVPGMLLHLAKSWYVGISIELDELWNYKPFKFKDK